jgi:hypothetical protein
MKFALLFVGAFIFTCASCWAQAEQQEVRHHGMMHAADVEHPVSKTAKLTVANNPASHEMNIRIGPVSLPTDAEHTPVAQPPVVWLTIPLDGWLTAFHPSIVDAKGQALPNKLLDHVALYDTAQADFLCPNKEEHVFGSGPEMSDWLVIPGYGYRVHKDDRIRITTALDNSPAKNYHDVFLQIRVEYQLAGADSSAPLRDIYPAWFNVTECSESGYDLSPGESTKTGQFKLRYSGKLLGVGGRLHDYGQWLVLKNESTKQTIATLEADIDSKGRIVAVPAQSFAEQGGVSLRSGDLLTVTDAYNNPTGRLITDGATGIIVGYFLPDQESQLTASRPVDERPQTR